MLLICKKETTLIVSRDGRTYSRRFMKGEVFLTYHVERAWSPYSLLLTHHHVISSKREIFVIEGEDDWYFIKSPA